MELELSEVLAIIFGFIATVGVFYTVRSFYRKKESNKQTAIGKNIYQANRDIKIERSNND
ncbi:hypothetical protein [Maridesulfovibrio sp.]|uniref:hypothetical protein n=1 Tax=unclassified Maridesulfovibrio TaxID=2794999 RepID=UPI003B000795